MNQNSLINRLLGDYMTNLKSKCLAERILRINILILTILVILFFMGSAAAADNSGQIPEIKNNVTKKIDVGCCSVLLHVKKGYDVFAYRRDATYAANLYIRNITWYGKETIKEYKETNGYFFHTIITKDGWIIGTGGPDIPYLNRELENLAGRITVNGSITSTCLNDAYKILKKLGMGSFIIKAPDDYVGLAIYKSGRSKIKVFKMKDYEYVSVPNSPRYYREGILTSKKSEPISAAIYLAGTDRWGVNRRNIITYEVNNTNNSTQVKVLASFDGGKLVGITGRGKPDNIIFMGQKIMANTLPRIPGKKYIGQITLNK